LAKNGSIKSAEKYLKPTEKTLDWKNSKKNIDYKNNCCTQFQLSTEDKECTNYADSKQLLLL